MKPILIVLIFLNLAFFAHAQNVVQMEYSLDTDAGVGRNRLVNLAPSPDGNFPVTVDPSGVQAGYHLLYMRTKDDNGVWSQTSRKYIQVLLQQTQHQIVAGEYFFDLDPGVGTAGAIVVAPQDSLVLQNFTAAVSGLSPGPHKLYVRFRDAYGGWSQTSRSTVEVVPVQTQHLVQGEYYFDRDPGFGSGSTITISPQDSMVMTNFTAATSSLLPGQHILYERLIDSYGKWSQTTRRIIDVVKNPDTSYMVSLEYFFNNDPGIGNADLIKIPVPFQSGMVTFNIPLNKLPPGMDTLFIRTQDSSDYNWSLTKWIIPSQNPLPLTLLSFTAARQNKAVQLNWQTENEFNTAYFNVQRSVDGNRYVNLSKVNAKGNSVAKSNYNYADDVTGITAEKLYYRLQQADIDGATTYSNIVLVTIEAANIPFSIMPNPASDFITLIPRSGMHPDQATVLITDLAGHTLIKQKITNTGSVKIPVSSLPKGVYTISIITTGKMQTQKLIIR